MKRISISLCILSLFLVATAFRFDGDGQKIPSASVKSLDGKNVNTADFTNDGKPIIIDFWATWCIPCKKELNEIAEVYSDWQTETGVKLIAISIDDQRNSPKVKPYVESQAWDYEVYLDENSDFKRAMNVNNVPHVCVVNGKGEIVWSHDGFQEVGGVDELHNIVKQVAANGKPTE